MPWEQSLEQRDMVGNAAERSTVRKRWNYHPDFPIQHGPVFAWPPRPAAALLSLTKRWVTLSGVTIFLAFALLVYNFVQPELAAMRVLSFDWVALTYARNLALLTGFAGALHLYLFTFTAQGESLKFDVRPMEKNKGTFTFRDQVRDNMFWSLASGVTVWTVLEVLYFWSAANGYVQLVTFAEAPVWIVVSALVLPFYRSAHFYWIHRMLHWPPLYKRFHALHHRNTNIGPWSGMSMHPVESTIYMSSMLIHFIVPSHPVIVLLHLYSTALGPALSHSGFEKVLVKGKRVMDSGHFHHQLHHRYFECNYGTPDMPWDEWFGSFHDGTDEAMLRIKENRRRKYAKSLMV